MDLDTCVNVLNSKGIALYVDGAAVLVDGEKIGTMTSLTDAESVIAAYKNLSNNKNTSGITCVEVTVPLSETKDFATMLTALKVHLK